MAMYTVNSRLSAPSPTVALEKGAYRMRAPPPPSRLRRRTRSSANPASARALGLLPHARERRLVLLLLLLVCATLACFGAAYYLFSTRCAAPGARDAPADAPRVVVDFRPYLGGSAERPAHRGEGRGAGLGGSVADPVAVRPAVMSLSVAPSRYAMSLSSSGSVPNVRDKSSSASEDAEERFLSYLPHSGFHNQRIAFENALVLARLLNRTLLVPPVRLGSRPLFYKPFDELSANLAANASKAGLEHCQDAVVTPAAKSEQAEEQEDELDTPVFPEECEGYFEYTNVPWDWLVDLSGIRANQRLVARWNFTDAWLEEQLDITANETYALRDLDRNDFGFQDFVPRAKPTARKYREYIYIPILAERPERLLQLGTLFGSARLHLRNRENAELRKRVRQAMAFANAPLLTAADTIRSALGGAYLAAHVRVGDGLFEENGAETVRRVWWKLLRALGHADGEILALERTLLADALDGADWDPDMRAPPKIAPDGPALRTPHPPLPPLPRPRGRRMQCPAPLHTSAALRALNTPLFLATDAHDPRTHPLLGPLVRTFPCAFFLRDFGRATAPLARLESGEDGVRLGPFLMPFLDAMVAGQAWAVVGTEGSTFSTFVEDVLWRTYHGWEIVQRG
ncbi:hypothetical protein CERSUDRAFT_111744 [Gelatoporia subvermispora B]|uniref:O-fucosyltransferase family protein n=1 Tax=Ceriporiopsis subvermispora (strain B) TaxID=914234 RepID=M2RLV7_CERS8|nr:hypothetical protein CERSUDRAFT_111744 [Gelatoporia subvermispora B]